jgi:hypothetical protein
MRDAAFALKHGELRGKKPRLVQRAAQVTSYSGAFDEAVFDRSAFDTEAVVWIEGNDPAHSRRADELTRAVLGIFKGMVYPKPCATFTASRRTKRPSLRCFASSTAMSATSRR